MIQWDTLRRIANGFIDAMDRRTKVEQAKADALRDISSAIRERR